MFQDFIYLLIICFVYFCIGRLCISFSEKEHSSQKIIIKIFNYSFFLYSIYFFLCFFTHSEDAFSKYPTTFADSIKLYEFAVDLSEFPFPENIKEAFSDFVYSELPGAVTLFTLQLSLAKMLFELSAEGELYAIIAGVSFCAALIPTFIGKTLDELDLLNKKTGREICIFATFSFVLYYSAFLMRDIHVMLLYTLLVYLFSRKECTFRYIYIVIVTALLFSFRIENGMFAFAYSGAYIYCRRLSSVSRNWKILIFTLFAGLGVLTFCLVYKEMFSVLQRYNERSLDAASTDSFGAKIATKVPFPLNYIFLTAFSQILPFPIYHFAGLAHTNVLIHSVTIFTPFYWFYIMYVTLKDYYYSCEKKVLWGYFLLISGLYLFLTSIGEFNPRRQMAVYPFILVSYFYYSRTDTVLSKRKSFFYTLAILLFLHLVYYLLKMN